jgi:hypothetical protein
MQDVLVANEMLELFVLKELYFLAQSYAVFHRIWLVQKCKLDLAHLMILIKDVLLSANISKALSVLKNGS